jgi:hypothetical protein
MSAKAIDLFDAYAQDKLPKDGGFVVSSFFDATSTYSIYEVVAYSGVKSIYATEEGLTFQTDGAKLYVLVEPASYAKKYIEPFRRDSNQRIPHRFSELDIYTAKNQTRVMVSAEPIMTYSSFTVLKPTGMNFALLFYNLTDVLETVGMFFGKTLNKEAAVPQSDSKKAAEYVVEGVKKFNIR